MCQWFWTPDRVGGGGLIGPGLFEAVADETRRNAKVFDEARDSFADALMVVGAGGTLKAEKMSEASHSPCNGLGILRVLVEQSLDLDAHKGNLGIDATEFRRPSKEALRISSRGSRIEVVLSGVLVAERGSFSSMVLSDHETPLPSKSEIRISKSETISKSEARIKSPTKE